jgi:hypothetical protein
VKGSAFCPLADARVLKPTAKTAVSERNRDRQEAAFDLFTASQRKKTAPYSRGSVTLLNVWSKLPSHDRQGVIVSNLG